MGVSTDASCRIESIKIIYGFGSAYGIVIDPFKGLVDHLSLSNVKDSFKTEAVFYGLGTTDDDGLFLFPKAEHYVAINKASLLHNDTDEDIDLYFSGDAGVTEMGVCGKQTIPKGMKISVLELEKEEINVSCVILVFKDKTKVGLRFEEIADTDVYLEELSLSFKP